MKWIWVQLKGHNLKMQWIWVQLNMVTQKMSKGDFKYQRNARAKEEEVLMGKR